MDTERVIVGAWLRSEREANPACAVTAKITMCKNATKTVIFKPTVLTL